MPTRLLTILLLLAAPLAAQADPVRYRLDPVHTRVLFAVEHAGFSRALGTVSGSEGELWFDEDDLGSARLQVEVPLQRLDLGDKRWNEATLARNLLDAQRFPSAHFASTRVEPTSPTHARVQGQLTLHGVTREVTLDVTVNAVKRHPMPPFRRTAGFSATTTLKRSDFGIDAWPSMIGDDVELRIEAEAIRERGGAASEATQATPPPPPVDKESSP